MQMSNNLLLQCFTDLVGCRYVLSELLPEDMMSFRYQDILYHLVAQRLVSNDHSVIEGSIKCAFSVQSHDDSDLKTQILKCTDAERFEARDNMIKCHKEKKRVQDVLNIFVKEYMPRRFKEKHLRKLSHCQGQDQSTFPIVEYMSMSSNYINKDILANQIAGLLDTLQQEPLDLKHHMAVNEIIYLTLKYFQLYMILLQYGVELYEKYPGVVKFPELMPKVNEQNIVINATFNDITNFNSNLCIKMSCFLPQGIWSKIGEFEQGSYLCYTKLQGYGWKKANSKKKCNRRNVRINNKKIKDPKEVDVMLSRG